MPRRTGGPVPYRASRAPRAVVVTIRGQRAAADAGPSRTHCKQSIVTDRRLGPHRWPDATQTSQLRAQANRRTHAAYRVVRSRTAL